MLSGKIMVKRVSLVWSQRFSGMTSSVRLNWVFLRVSIFNIFFHIVFCWVGAGFFHSMILFFA